MFTNESLINYFKEVETSLLLTTTRINSKKLNEILSDDFIEIGASGIIFDKQSVIKALKSESFLKYTIADFKLTQLSKEIVLINYSAYRDVAGQHSKSDSLRSSIWKKFGSQWKIVFQQGTSISE